MQTIQAAEASPRLPGVRARTVFLISGLVFWALVLPMALLIALMTAWPTQAGGHLPWPVAQWALTTPAGLVVLLAICVGIGAPRSLWGSATSCGAGRLRAPWT